LPGSSGLRQPRLRLIANGARIDGVIAAELTSNNHYAADRFRATIAIGPGAGGPGTNWAEAASIFCDLQLSLDAGLSWTSLVQGAVDSIDIDPVGGTVRIAGRDLAAALIETRTQETFANQTSSEIATTLAGRHGLQADAQATTTPVGRYWQLEHDRITLDQFSATISEWDLLTTLAQHEGFDVWVSGTTLHFRPRGIAGGPEFMLRPVATISGAANVAGLRLERSLTLAGDIEVVVKSWNSRQQNAFVQTARAAREPGTSRKRKPQRYVYVVPNLTPDEALKLAQRRLAELTRHERVIDAEMPGELDLAPRMMIGVEGTGTGFDQVYWIDEIERSLHVGHGFTQRLRARNANVGSQATSPADRIRSGIPATY
jgi:phage protein D